MPIKIPDKIKILARTYEVKWVNDLAFDKSAAGEIAYRSQEIRLQPSFDNAPCHHESIESAFFHELIHGVLFELSYLDLNADERFVDQVGNVIYAALRDAGMLKEAIE